MATTSKHLTPLLPQYHIVDSPEDSKSEKLQEIALECCQTIVPPLIAALNLILAFWWVFFRPPHPTTTLAAQLIWFLPLLLGMFVSFFYLIWQNSRNDLPDRFIATLTALSSSVAILWLLRIPVGSLWSSLKPYPESDLFEICFMGVFIPGLLSIPALVGLGFSWCAAFGTMWTN